MDINSRIQSLLSAKKTHKVVTAYSDGRTREHETASLPQAENYATAERRKIGRELIDRTTGNSVFVASVRIVEI